MKIRLGMCCWLAWKAESTWYSFAEEGTATLFLAHRVLNAGRHQLSPKSIPKKFLGGWIAPGRLSTPDLGWYKILALVLGTLSTKYWPTDRGL